MQTLLEISKIGTQKAQCEYFNVDFYNDRYNVNVRPLVGAYSVSIQIYVNANGSTVSIQIDVTLTIGM